MFQRYVIKHGKGYIPNYWIAGDIPQSPLAEARIFTGYEAAETLRKLNGDGEIVPVNISISLEG